MSAGDHTFVVPPEKKLRFRSGSKIHFRNDNKVEDIFRQSDGKGRKDDCNGNSKDIKRKPPERSPSLLAFLQIELTRGYLLEHDEERFSARREKVYSFMKIPKELEKFMVYGFFQCADSLLFVYTFLPLRFVMALWSLFSRPIRRCLGLINYKSQSLLKPAETCDLLKGFILIVCCVLMYYIDTNMMYHVVKSQSVMKLYIFYNMLEVADRLFSALGQDTIDALFWTATEPRDRKREHVGVILHLIFALVYVFFHSILVLFQATTLNVAFNSNNKSLLIIMMSNNFVELKGSVFKKFDKNNLFQVSCSDVRERLHLFVLLFVVVLQTMKEYLWKEERFWVLLPDCMIVLIFEVIIDWIKHAFITRFNEIPSGIYKEYNLSLAYDVAQTRQKHAFTDHSDLVARRMGFIPLPLGVVIMRILLHAVHIDSLVAVILVMIGYACLAALRILVSIVILGKACDLIDQHKAGTVPTTSPQNSNTPKKEASVSRDSATSPTKPEHWSATPELQIIKQKSLIKKEPNMPEPLCDATMGAAAIFSNSAVDLNGVCCLNEKLLVEPQIKQETSTDLLETDVSRSEPDIKGASDSILDHHIPEEYRSLGVPGSPKAQTPTEGFKKRSESTPNLVKTAEGDSDMEC